MILTKDKAGDLVSPVTVAEVMRSRDMSAVGELAISPASPACPPVHRRTAAMSPFSRTFAASAASRRLSPTPRRQWRAARLADIIAGRLEAALVASEGHTGGRGPVSMLAAVTTAMQQTLAAYQGEASTAVKTGIHALNAIISGLYPGEFVLSVGAPQWARPRLRSASRSTRRGPGMASA